MIAIPLKSNNYQPFSGSPGPGARAKTPVRDPGRGLGLGPRAQTLGPRPRAGARGQGTGPGPRAGARCSGPGARARGSWRTLMWMLWGSAENMVLRNRKRGNTGNTLAIIQGPGPGAPGPWAGGPGPRPGHGTICITLSGGTSTLMTSPRCWTVHTLDGPTKLPPGWGMEWGQGC